MGWRERDWAKFTREEFDSIYGGGSSSPFQSSTGPGRSPTPSARRPGRSRRRHSQVFRAFGLLAVAVVATALIFGAMVVTGNVKDPGNLSGGENAYLSFPTPLPVVISPPVQAPDPSIVRIRWGVTDLSPAANAGRICVTTSAHGRMCASYVVGERPADTLTRRIETLGLRVQSSGSG